jgi:hypothetical protein
MQTIFAGIYEFGTEPETNVSLAALPGASLERIRARDAQGYLAQASAFAILHHTWLGTGLYIRGENLWMALFDADGRLAVEQPATHLNPSWTDGLRRGTELHVHSTPFGKVALLPDVDVYKPEVARIAALQGAEIVICSQVIFVQDYRFDLVLAGVWQEAQQNCLFALHTNNLTSAILGPCEVTVDHSGFLAGLTSELPISAQLSAEKRLAVYRNFPVFKSLNPAVYREYQRELCL